MRLWWNPQNETDRRLRLALLREANLQRQQDLAHLMTEFGVRSIHEPLYNGGHNLSTLSSVYNTWYNNAKYNGSFVQFVDDYIDGRIQV